MSALFRGNRPLIAVYWGDRVESVTESACSAMQVLTAIHPGVWTLRSDGSTLTTVDGIEEAIRKRAGFEGTHDPLGFDLEVADETGRSVDLTVGAHPDMARVRTPNSVVVDATALDGSSQRAILMALVRATSPEWGVITTYGRMMSLAMEGSPGAPHVGSLTFFAARRGRLPPLPEGALVTWSTEGSTVEIVGQPFEEVRDRTHDFLARRKLLRPLLVAPTAVSSSSGSGTDLQHAVAFSFLHHALRAADVGVVSAGAAHGPADLALFLEEGLLLHMVPHLVIDIIPTDGQLARTYRGSRLTNHEAAGVPWVWVLDLRLRLLEVFERGPDGRYVRAQSVDGTSELPGLLTVTIELDDLFAELDRLCP